MNIVAVIPLRPQISKIIGRVQLFLMQKSYWTYVMNRNSSCHLYRIVVIEEGLYRGYITYIAYIEKGFAKKWTGCWRLYS